MLILHLLIILVTAAVILPSLQCLHNDSLDLKTIGGEFHGLGMAVRKISEDKWKKLSDVDLEREDECGICLEPCTKIVLPNCYHAMCINCYHDWYSPISFSSFSCHCISLPISNDGE